VAERFFWSLKYGWTNHCVYPGLESARQSVFNYIEIFYNQRRLHQTLDWVSPSEFESEFHNHMTTAAETIENNTTVTAV
jgi:putative transposase